MDKILETHFNRVFASVLKRHTAASIFKWIPANTTHALIPFSYDKHEYQEKILADTSQEVNVQKCSQVGISEVSARKALALVNVVDPYTVCYTLPTAHFAGTFMKTRIDPIIQGSETMRASIHRTNDNSEMKQFGLASFLYCKGAASSNAPISIPVDHLIHDEWDFSDQEVLGQYHSRLTHSAWQKIDRFSTPTLPNFGIHKQMQESRRHYLFCKCNHCNHFFVPNYYDHVKIPGFTGDLREINKQTLMRIRWKEAALRCPKCGDVPSLLPQHREWVVENASEAFVAAGYQVSPFDAPLVIKVSFLVEKSTSYSRRQDFDNFNLGLAAEDSEATLSAKDFEGVFQHIEVGSGGVYVMAVDVGAVYHFAVGRVDGFGHIVVVHTEQVPMGKARERYWELHKRFRVVCSVMDSAPHAETVMALQTSDANLYASVYVRSKGKGVTAYTVVEKDQKDDEGRKFVRQVNVNRSRAFDGYMEFIRSNQLTIVESEEKETIIEHHSSMKRVKVFDNDSQEMTYSWEKSDGNDHYHHTFVMLWVASQIKGVGKATVLIPLTSIHRFRLRQN